MDMENSRLVGEMLDMLDDREQEVLKSRYLYGYTQEETAEKLGIPRGTVWSIEQRAFKKLNQ